MGNDDFNSSDSDHTQIFPMPGGRREDVAKMLQEEREQRPKATAVDEDATIFQASPSYSGSENSAQPIPSAPTTSNNKLVDAASPLLVLIAHISNTIDARDTHQLKRQISDEINQFQRQCHRDHIDDQTIQDASYILCTVMDEAVLNTPWGQQSDWHINTLLGTHFSDVRGGNVFFDKLKQFSAYPDQNIQMLKLMYFCLSLGFQGRYRHELDPAGKLNYIKSDTADKIRTVESISNNEHLSPHWLGITGAGESLRNSIPAWLIGAITVSLLLGVFSTLFFLLSSNSSKVIAAFDLVAFNEAKASEEPVFITPPPRIAPPPPVLDRSISYVEGDKQTTFSISGDFLFSSGSATVSKSLYPALIQLADALNQRPGQIEITGHSDNIPIKSARLKSRYPGGNIELSQARADNVGLVLKDLLDDPSRIRTRGVGSEFPIDTANTKAARKKNRRVDIVVFH